MSEPAVASQPEPGELQARKGGAPIYQMLMLALSLLALIAIALQNAFQLDPEVELILLWTDNAICAVFLVDFFVTFWRAPDRLRYMYTWGWVDLISSIPTLDIARWGRIARIARVARLLRALRASRLLSKVILQKQRQSTAAAGAMIAFLMIIACSTAMLQMEKDPASNIKTAEDAVWWAFTTITTVGYGDKFPVTPEGRIVGAILMTVGVGLFGALSATLAAAFIAREEKQQEDEIAVLREEIASLREAIEKLTAASANR
jgi:voltage-gated potassium channel